MRVKEKKKKKKKKENYPDKSQEAYTRGDIEKQPGIPNCKQEYAIANCYSHKKLCSKENNE